MNDPDPAVQLVSFDRMRPGERGLFKSVGRLLHCERHLTKANILTVWAPNEPHKRLDSIIDEKPTYIHVAR
jgi:hypothetical protein